MATKNDYIEELMRLREQNKEMREALREAEHLIRDREYASTINFDIVRAKIDKALFKAEGKDGYK